MDNPTPSSCVACGAPTLSGETLATCPACQLAALRPASSDQTARTGLEKLPSIYGLLIVEKIGEGGMGTVYRAERTGGPTQQLAVKVMRFTGRSHDDAVRRFTDEIAALVKVSHPNVARFIDSGLTADGRSYYLMDWVQGPTLRHFLHHSQAALSVGERLDLARKICASVAACHQVGIVHRDLHPDNILIDPQNEPKLLDFGISKILPTAEGAPPTSATRDGAIVGHPEYLSPEQIQQKPIGPGADVFVLGLLLCEILTGTHPFPAKSEGELDRMTAIRDQEPLIPPLPGAPKDITAVVRKCLQKEPSLRYGSARELGEDLDRAIAGQPVIARPLTASYVLARQLSRHRAAALWLMLLFSVLLAAFIANTWREAETERAELQRQREHLLESGALSGQRGEWNAALHHYERALAIGANPMQTRFSMVAAALATGQHERALKTLTECEKHATTPPDRARLDYWRAHLATGATGIEPARDALRRAVDTQHLPAIEDLIARALLESDPAQSLPLLDRALLLSPFDRQALTAKATQLLLSGKSQDSIQSLEATHRLFPADPNLPILLVQALARSNRADEARELAKKLPESTDPEAAGQLLSIIEGLEVGQSYYEAAWNQNAFLRSFAYTNLLRKLTQSSPLANPNNSASSLLLQNMSRFASADLAAIRAANTIKDLEALDQELDRVLSKIPLSIAGASSMVGLLLPRIYENPDDEQIALRYCTIIEEMLALSESDQLRALNLEFATLAHVLHGKFHQRPESYQTAAEHIRQRFDVAIPIAETPADTLLKAAQHIGDIPIQAELARRHLALQPKNPARILTACKFEALEGSHTKALTNLLALLTRDDLAPEIREQAEQLREKIMTQVTTILKDQ